MDVDLEIGTEHTATLVVEARHTAERLGSGDLPVLGTPAVLAFAEATCVALIGGGISAALTTVGTHASIDHLKATGLGKTVSATATLRDADGRKVAFEVVVEEEAEVVATVRHERVVVERDRFMARV